MSVRQEPPQSSGGAGGAPTDATYITQTAHADLSAEQALASLSSGIMRVATTTGVITSLTTSADIAANISDETGSGLLVFGTSPTLSTPIMSGTPDGAADVGYDTTQKMLNTYGGATAIAARIPMIIATGVGTETKINDTASAQDFTSIFTFPANSIYTNKVFRLYVLIETVTGTSSVTFVNYLKLGATTIYTNGANDAANGQTRSAVLSFLIFGREAAGAAANVSTASAMQSFSSATSLNQTNQPVALATNGTLALTLGVTYSGTGSTESQELQAWVLEELN